MTLQGSEAPPTDADVRAGDYTRFGWQRARVADLKPNVRTPLLWDRKPQDGKYLVAYSDASIRYVAEDEFHPPK
jgi:hypothetical protein